MSRAVLYILTGFAILLSSCRKEDPVEVDATVLSVGRSTDVEEVLFLNENLGFACGGDPSHGYIWRTQDGGQTWSEFSNTLGRKIYTLYFIDENIGFAGGDFMHMWKTTDGGDTWNMHWFAAGQLAFHEVHRPIIRKFHFTSDSVGHLVGGENYQVGVTYRTTDQGLNWEFDTIRHEIRGLDFYNASRGIVAGFGYVANTTDGGLTFTQQDVSGEFFVDVQLVAESTAIAATLDGEIYRSTNFGVDWEKLSSPRMHHRRHYLNDISFFNHNLGYAVGADGFILKSTDSGESWSLISVGTERTLHSISYLGTKAYIAADYGEVIVFEAY